MRRDRAPGGKARAARTLLIALLIALALLSGCRYQVVENASHVTVDGP